MNQLTNYNCKIDFYYQNGVPLSPPIQTTIEPKRKRKIKILCNECNQRRELLDKSHQVCHVCYKAKSVYVPSGNKVIDDFIKYTLINSSKLAGKMVFVPYNQFNDVEFISEGGFSKIYKAIWINGPPITTWCKRRQGFFGRRSNYPVVLKKLNNSKNVTTKELNELKIFYEFCLNNNKKYNRLFIINYERIGRYFGITQDPVTQDVMIIMPYYQLGDLIKYINTDFYSIDWRTKLNNLVNITDGLIDLHSVNIVHRDFHSGNIFFDVGSRVFIGDLGISKSATESANDKENYGIIPYMAPEIFQGQEYTTASDIYSFGMIMWEFMTGRRPFWNIIHDAELIIEICDGLRPPIVTNAPEGYIELMKECWHSDPGKRPKVTDVNNKILKMHNKEERDSNNNNSTKIIKSSDIGPVTTNNPGAIYKSRPLSGMIQSAMFTMSTRRLRSRSLTAEIDPLNCHQKNNISFNDKRKFDENQITENSFDEDKIIKKIKLIENENNDYTTQEFEFDIDINSEQCTINENK